MVILKHARVSETPAFVYLDAQKRIRNETTTTSTEKKNLNNCVLNVQCLTLKSFLFEPQPHSIAVDTIKMTSSLQQQTAVLESNYFFSLFVILSTLITSFVFFLRLFWKITCEQGNENDGVCNECTRNQNIVFMSEEILSFVMQNQAGN